MPSTILTAVLTLFAASSLSLASASVSARAMQSSSMADLELISALEPSDPSRFDPVNGPLLAPFMIPRVSGTANNTIVQNFILDYFAKLNQTSLAGESPKVPLPEDHSKPISAKLKKKRATIQAHHDRFEKRAPETPGTGWHVEVDEFEDQTPFGPKTFTNIIMTKNPNAENRLVFAAHFDSKYFPPADKLKAQWNGGLDTLPFIAATDSAVPCAIMLDLASSLDSFLDSPHRTDKDTTLQLVFFDGEEAFLEWTDKDSTYGSRHLAQKWQQRMVHRTRTATGRNGGSTANYLEGIELFVLLDLLGAEKPQVPSYFSTTQWAHRHTMSIEQRLWEAGLHGVQALAKIRQGGDADADADEDNMDALEEENHVVEGFLSGNHPWGGVEDDHIPFLNRGVPVFHVIPVPFPHVWHTLEDDATAISKEVVSGWANIFRAFTVEYLSLLQPRQHKRDEL
ncbi:MAG: hypothetical protein BYD32DRAFT_433451 [Podila humilis]|nr:MAG: hypothetical protein BYD32DRAFT_433451 [Podila humilis]